MAKESGLGALLIVEGTDLSGDTASIGELSGGPKLLEVTGLDKQAMERIGGVRDGKLAATSFFNPTRAHPVLSLLPTSDVRVCYGHRSTLDAPAAVLQAVQVNYDGTRGTDGAFTFAVDAESDQYGLQWGNLRTAGLQAASSASNLTSVDDAASTAFGAQMFAFLTAFTGTSVTISIQDSADNSSFAGVTSLTTTAMTTAGAQRAATASGATIRRYTRVNLAGTFSAATVAVVLVRNQTQVDF